MAYKDDFMVGDHDLYQTFKRVTELGATVLVHAENGNMIDFVSNLCVSRCRLVANNNLSYHNQSCNSLDYSWPAYKSVFQRFIYETQMAFK